MASSRRPRPLSVVLFTIATTLVLLAITPVAASHDVSGPLIDVEVTDVWTNDDGSPDPGDAGDTGQVSPLYDAWDVSPLSSSDPKGPGFGALREDKDVAICTGRVSPSDPGIVEVSIANGYPAYVCTLNTVIYNGSGLPIAVALAVIEADPGLAVQTGAVQPPASLGPGGQAEAMFSVGVLNTAPQSTTLHAVISMAVTAEESPTPHGHIIVDKETVPAGDTQGFNFTSSYGPAFSLSDGSAPNDSGPLTPGPYSVTEVSPLPTRWSLASAICSDGSSPTAIDLNPGETVTCVFTNTFEGETAGPQASLTITKVATPLVELDSTAFQFGGSLGAFALQNGESAVFSELDGGPYTVSETLSGGWELTGVECTAPVLALDLATATVTVNLAEGEVAQCTFTNEEQEETLGPTGSLTIEKEAAPADDTVFSFDGGVLGDFELQDPSEPSVIFGELEAGAYTVTELAAGGDWQFAGVECSALDWSASGSSVVVNLAEGEAALCTFRNATDLPYTGASRWLVPTLLIGLAALLLGLVVMIETRRRETR